MPAPLVPVPLMPPPLMPPPPRPAPPMLAPAPPNPPLPPAPPVPVARHPSPLEPGILGQASAQSWTPSPSPSAVSLEAQPGTTIRAFTRRSCPTTF
jgi:hypothetical protein